ncbi:MAG TPA: Hsp20/alpha crystallin family protein [Clostridiales bacterium]|nr:Hsp20/alpha crystallin family protein [Clostridiales bacterium]
MLALRNNGWLTTFDPFENLDTFDSMFGSVARCSTDVTDEGDHFKLVADLPGFHKEDIHIDIDDNVLTISAEHSNEQKEEDKKHNYVFRERTYGSFKRSFRVEEIDQDQVSAAYENGVLTVTLPKKAEPEKLSKSINID